MEPDERILVPVDGSDGSERASRHALAIAAASGAAVDFLHVVTTGGRRSLGTRLDPEMARVRGDTVLGTAGRLADAADIEVTTERVEGRPPEEILAYATARDSHLVVMSRRGASRAGTRLLGGVTDKVLRASERPVLVVPPGDQSDPEDVAYERILLPTDGSECAAAAAAPCAALATAFGATVHVVSAVGVGEAAGPVDEPTDPGSVDDRWRARAEAAVEGMVDRLTAAADLPVERAVVRGRPADALREYVEANDVDAVAMGAHGRGPLSRWVLGSVTDRLLRTVDVPILVVRENA